jgi:hypothetical protein
VAFHFQVLAVAGLLFALPATQNAHADPITLDEKLSGDLPAALPAPTVFAFDIGLNTVSGSLAFLPNREFDVDSFAFSTPTGTEITAITYSAATRFRPGVVSSQSAFSLLRGNGGVDGTYLDDFQALSCAPSCSPTVMAAFLAAPPLGPGIYSLENFGLAFTYLGGTPGEGFSQNYTWSFRVSETTAPIPEPASLSLLTLTLAWLAVRHRMRTHPAAGVEVDL